MTKYVGLFEINLTPKSKKWKKNAWCFIKRADHDMMVGETAETWCQHQAASQPKRFVYVEVEV